MLGVRIPPALPTNSRGTTDRTRWSQDPGLLRFDPALPRRGEGGDEEGVLSVARRGVGTTIVVLVTSVVFAIYLWVADLVIVQALQGWSGSLSVATSARPSDRNWYIVHTYSGFEERVKETLRQRADALGMASAIGEIRIPTETVVEYKGGKKRETQRKFFPGYILVEMEMSDEAWHVVKNTPKVTGFVGTGKKPTPLSAGGGRPDPRAGGDREGEAEAEVRVREGRAGARSSTGRSTTSPAWSRTSTSTAARSRSWSRSSAGTRRSSWISCRCRSSRRGRRGARNMAKKSRSRVRSSCRSRPGRRRPPRRWARPWARPASTSWTSARPSTPAPRRSAG